MTSSPAIMLALSTIGFCTGGVFLKRFADGDGATNLGIALTVFLFSNLAYARLLANGLGQGAIMSSMAHLVVMSAAGALVFGERFGAREGAALSFAVMAAWLAYQSGPNNG